MTRNSALQDGGADPTHLGNREQQQPEQDSRALGRSQTGLLHSRSARSSSRYACRRRAPAVRSDAIVRAGRVDGCESTDLVGASTTITRWQSAWELSPHTHSRAEAYLRRAEWMKPEALVARLRGTGGDFETFGALTSGTRGCVFN